MPPDLTVTLSPSPLQEPTTYFHEISHNLYCNHAGKWGNKGYEDLSGAMGYCCDIRCHNAVHSYQVGGGRQRGCAGGDQPVAAGSELKTVGIGSRFA
mgnify:CR=1 FL=1